MSLALALVAYVNIWGKAPNWECRTDDDSRLLEAILFEEVV